MADNTSEYLVNVTTKGDPSGAAKVVNSLKQVEGEAKVAGAAGKQMGRDIAAGEQQAEVAGGGLKSSLKDVGTGLKAARGLGFAFSQILMGDVDNGLKLATTSVKGLSAAVRANPLGLLAAGAGLLITLGPKLAAMFGLFDTGSEQIKAAGDESKTTGTAVGGLADKVQEVASFFDQAAAFAKGFAEELAKDTKNADTLRKALEALADAKNDRDLAKIQQRVKSGEITPAEGALQSKEIEAERTRRHGSAAENEATGDLATATEARDAIAGQQAEAEAKAKAAAEQRKALEEQVSQVVADKANVQGGISVSPGVSPADATRMLQPFEDKLNELTAAMEAATKEENEQRARAGGFASQRPDADAAVQAAQVKLQTARVERETGDTNAASDVGEAEAGLRKEQAAKTAAAEKAASDAVAEKNRTAVAMLKDEAASAEALVKELEAAKTKAESGGQLGKIPQLEEQITRAKLRQQALNDAASAREKAPTAGQQADAAASAKLTAEQGAAAAQKAREAVQKQTEEEAKEKQKKEDERAKEEAKERAKHPRRIHAAAKESPEDQEEDRRKAHFDDDFHRHVAPSHMAPPSHMPSTAAPDSGAGALKESADAHTNSAQQLLSAAQTLQQSAGSYQQAASNLESIGTTMQQLATAIANLQGQMSQVQSQIA
jgi:hypothetical protein